MIKNPVVVYIIIDIVDISLLQFFLISKIQTVKKIKI